MWPTETGMRELAVAVSAGVGCIIGKSGDERATNIKKPESLFRDSGSIVIVCYCEHVCKIIRFS